VPAISSSVATLSILVYVKIAKNLALIFSGSIPSSKNKSNFYVLLTYKEWQIFIVKIARLLLLTLHGWEGLTDWLRKGLVIPWLILLCKGGMMLLLLNSLITFVIIT
jgi:hypothetical protein